MSGVLGRFFTKKEKRSGGGDRQSSLDTGCSSIDTGGNTIDTGDTQETSSSVEFVDCPFLGHRYYQPVRELIRQSLGQVYLAVNKETGQQVVIKLIERGPTVSKHVESELLLHRKCTGHPNIIQLIEVFLTQHYLAIVLEYAPGGDLLDYVTTKGRLSESEARWFFQQLVMGLAYFHSVGVDHRELNINNKLLTGDPSRPILKIQDFTYRRATPCSSTSLGSLCWGPGYVLVYKSEQINSDPNSALGSLPYTAPEVLTNTLRHGHQADVWSLGVALFKMVCGRFPFERSEDQRDQRTAVQNVLSRIAKARRRWEAGEQRGRSGARGGVDYMIPSTVSPQLQDLLRRMLVRQPDQRLTLPQIMTHPWFAAEMPPGLMEINARVNGSLAKQSEDELVAVVREAQQSVRVIDADNVDDLADDILAEEEVDDILEELSLANSGDLNMQS
eukprot:scaffold13.g352.t1